MGGRVGMYSHSQVMTKMLVMKMISWLKMLVMTMISWYSNFAGPHLLDKPENGKPSSCLERGRPALSQRETVFNNRYNTDNKGDPLCNKMFVL